MLPLPPNADDFFGKPNFEQLYDAVCIDNATLRQQLADTIANRDAGVIELRKWVEGAGFTWCEDETAVFNVTTALGWLRGEVESSHERIAALEAERDELRAALEQIRAKSPSLIPLSPPYTALESYAGLIREMRDVAVEALKGQGDAAL